MRWNMVLGALVLSVGLCSQSFGFELLDRMLGMGCGCDAQASCCEKPCGAAAATCEMAGPSSPRHSRRLPRAA